MTDELKQKFDEYRLLLKARALEAKAAKKQGYNLLKRGNITKLRVLAFFERNGRWPKRKRGLTKTEAALGQRFENYLSKKALCFDPELRKIVMSTGRKSNHKRKHNIRKFKNDILNFLAEYGRVPSPSYEHQTIDGEARLRHKLDYYTKKAGDMTLLGQIYQVDKCHGSGIPVKYRKLINQSLDVEKPLTRLNKSDLK